MSSEVAPANQSGSIAGPVPSTAIAMPRARAVASIGVAATGKQSNGSDYVYPSTAKWFEKLKGGSKVTTKRREENAPVLNLKSHIKRSKESDDAKSATSSPVPTLSGSAVITLIVGVVVVAVLLVGFSYVHVYGHELFDLEITVIGSLVSAFVVLVSSFAWSFRSFSKSEPAFELPEPKLLTPKEVDAKVLAEGVLECDCGAVVTSLPFLDGSVKDSKESKRASRSRGASRWAWTGGTLAQI